MAIFTNLEATNQGKHGIFESSRLKSSIVGHIYDALVKDSDTPIAVDNGVCIKIGDYTGNGLQEVAAKVAGVKDKVAVTGAPVIIKDAFTQAQAQAYNYTNIAGNPVKSYEVIEGDIFAVAKYQFTSGSAAQVAVGAYVVLDGNGAYVAQSGAPEMDSYGFVGKIHSLSEDYLGQVTMVRIECVQNTQQA